MSVYANKALDLKLNIRLIRRCGLFYYVRKIVEGTSNEALLGTVILCLYRSKYRSKNNLVENKVVPVYANPMFGLRV